MPQERPKSPQEASKSLEERPQETQERPKPLPNGAQDRPKFIFRAFCEQFFPWANFTSISNGFLTDFKKLESLKTAIFLKENNDFYKINVFHFIAKFGSKMVALRVRNRWKIEENRRKKSVSKQVFF